MKGCESRGEAAHFTFETSRIGSVTPVGATKALPRFTTAALGFGLGFKGSAGLEGLSVDRSFPT